MARALVDTPLPLAGVPDGLAALPVGSTSSSGAQLRRDARRRTLIREVVFVATGTTEPPGLADADWNWVLQHPTRRWATITARYGDQAAGLATDLARAGVIRWRHHVDELLRLAEPIGWELTDPWRALRAERQDAWQALWSDAAANPAVAANPALAGWLERLAATGRLRRLAKPAATLTAALNVLAVLPATPSCTRHRLASMTLRDSHALDDTTDVGALVTHALAHLQHRSFAKLSSRARRALWARAGVETTPLLSRVSVAGLQPLPAGPITAGVAGSAGAGIATVLHLTAVRAEPWDAGVGTVVSVCENPSILDDAVSRLGSACPPLVCVEGEASDAAIALLESLAAHGARLRYHGDFGSGGIRIANRIIGRLGAAPWQFTTADHAAAASRLADHLDELPRLAGHVPAARWDTHLAQAITTLGVEIEEEEVLDDLIHDLESPRTLDLLCGVGDGGQQVDQVP
jgi:uncharacterized protein (TIGR02679 family)